MITSFADPDLRVAGTIILTWYVPAIPGAAPAKRTCAGSPAIVAETGAVTVESGLEGGGVPCGIAGLTAPSPVA